MGLSLGNIVYVGSIETAERVAALEEAIREARRRAGEMHG